ncbi:ArsR family transcriptional regulator [Streptomyces sp. ICBB 8177]|uniref:ArsR/SmtB family transcription factor n=1 Tax=Streptomyces sp. ICBB 8177 TaxID=563922 RepID=UPI000D680103|nr:ArsR family transcriptional regulator [Streptomyces sp. ICBB 8177]PWI44635.1 transcriptional regulator [Streptomyces sp. ICBB 8177]
MWQVGSSVRMLACGAADPVHRRWLEQVRPRVAAAGLDEGWLADLIPATGYVPDFLNPAPAGPAPTLAEELAAIVATPARRVRQDLDHLGHHQGRAGARLRSLYADPRSRLARIAKEIETYWQLALAPYWARIRTVLEADVLHRARQVSQYGVGHLLNELHPQVSWGDDVLRLLRSPRSLSRETAGAGLLLAPAAFKGPGLSTRIAPPDPPQLAYRARGTGTLWERRAVTSTAAVVAVLGRRRTLLLTELEAPATTTELAQRTGFSKAGVSQNLTALRNAGLVTAHRAGRSVLYARTSVAESLLAAGR